MDKLFTDVIEYQLLCVVLLLWQITIRFIVLIVSKQTRLTNRRGNDSCNNEKVTFLIIYINICIGFHNSIRSMS
jgi:hypothetical protein